MKREEFEALIGVFDAFITVRINKDENSILEFETVKEAFINKFVDKEDVEFKEGYSYIEKLNGKVVVEEDVITFKKKAKNLNENDKFSFKLVPDIKPIEQQKQIKLNKNQVVERAIGFCYLMFKQNASIECIINSLNNQYPDYYFYCCDNNAIFMVDDMVTSRFICKIPETAKFNDEE